jgi:short-subunit dehydrogenase involved in D-alanine esterification of teichoic acids
MAAQGFDVAISYNNSSNEALKLSQEIIQKFKVECCVFQANLFEKNAAKNLIKNVLEKFPNLNLLINNASIFQKRYLFFILLLWDFSHL